MNAMLPGKRVTGLTLGDAETRTLIPALVRLVADGRMPLGRLVRRYPFEEIQAAVADMVSGATVKPVLTF